GSLKVDVIVNKKATEQGAADFVDAALNVKDVKVVIKNETYSASVSSIGNLKVNQEKLDGSDSFCQLFLAANGHCRPQTKCTVIDSKPVCKEVTQESASADLHVIIGNVVGVSVILVGCFAIIYCVRMKNIKTKQMYRVNSDTTEEDTSTSVITRNHKDLVNMPGRFSEIHDHATESF
ncbi:hypothetical protein MAR_034049, partial [Mya arenaria]